MGIKRLLRSGINKFGFDIVRLKHSPQQTLLGISQQNIGTIIDVGANQGQFARMISRFFPEATIYCFEPLEAPFRKLSNWAASQGDRIRCFQFALGDQEGDMEMHLHEQHTPSSSLLAATDNCHEIYPQTRDEHITNITISTLDLAIKDDLECLPREILLKLDVQGFEDRVLRGGSKVLDHCKAVILEVCIDSLYEGQANFHILSQFLHGSGFQYSGNIDQAYGDNGRVVYLDAVFIKP